MKLLIATRNLGKFDGMYNMVSDLPFEVVSLQDIEVDDSNFVEDGETFEENAKKKARFYASKTGLMTISDDTGILIPALEGELGLRTRRWGAGPDASDEEWLDYFLKRMEKEENRSSLFVSCICLADKNGNMLFEARGESKGTLTRAPGCDIEPGIPLSAVFQPEGCTKVKSALTIEEKNRISHRGKAMKQIREFLEKNLDAFDSL